MRKRFYLLSIICFSFYLHAQQVTYEEYDLDNGLHVILHQDNTTPVEVTSVLYHEGAKNEDDERTGLVYFFEHLLFEKAENIELNTEIDSKSLNDYTALRIKTPHL